MATRTDIENHRWTPPRTGWPMRNAQPLHDYYQPTPSLKDTLIELAVTSVGVVGVFVLIMTLVKKFT
jgi:hypothetical protein